MDYDYFYELDYYDTDASAISQFSDGGTIGWYYNQPYQMMWVDNVRVWSVINDTIYTPIAHENRLIAGIPVVMQTYPNPGNQSIIFDFGNAGRATALEIYDIHGKLSKILAKGKQASRIVWDYKKDNISKGIYFCKPTNSQKIKPFVIVK